MDVEFGNAAPELITPLPRRRCRGLPGGTALSRFSPGAGNPRPSRSAVAAGAVGVLVLLAGCAQREASDVARIRAAKRAESRERVVYTWTQAERPRPERLERAARFIDWNERRHKRLLARDADFAAWWWQRDVDRGPQRRQRYGEYLDRIFGGKPERIERNAIILFY